MDRRSLNCKKSSALIGSSSNPPDRILHLTSLPPRMASLGLMTRTAFLCLLLLLVSATAILLGLNACGTTVKPARLGRGKLLHIVIIMQENRPPDNLFHDPVLMARGADIASIAKTFSGIKVPLEPAPLGVGYDVSHAHEAFLVTYDGGKMDGGDKVRIFCDIPPCMNAAFKYVRASDVAPYFQMAEQYTFADRMFKPIEAPVFLLTSSSSAALRLLPRAALFCCREY